MSMPPYTTDNRDHWGLMDTVYQRGYADGLAAAKKWLEDGIKFTVGDVSNNDAECYGYCHKAKDGETFTCSCPCCK